MYNQQQTPQCSIRLNPAELASVKEYANGLLLKEVADKLQRSKHTISRNLERAFRRLNINSRADLVHYCLATGIITNKYNADGSKRQ